MGWFRYAAIVSLLLCYIQPISEALKLIKPGQKLGVSDTLESEGGFYKLGFFAPDTNSNKLYLGIWFTKTKTKAVVWVSNKEEPFTSSSPLLVFDKDEENLIALDGKSSYQVTNATEKGKNAQVVLLDSGNLVMQDEDSNVLWESFDYPTDTLLAGMKLAYNNTIGKKWELYSWKSETDPSKGSVQMTLDDSGSGWTIIIRHKAQLAFAYGTYWLGDKLNSTWTLNIDGKEIVYSYFIKSEDYGQMSFENNRTDLFVRYKADETGKLKVLIWLEGYDDWSQLFQLPNKQCDFFGYCGRYAICDSRSLGNPCSCLPGYKQVSPDDWSNENYLEGYKRITDLQCGESETEFKFVEIPHVTLPAQSNITFGFANEKDCKKSCEKNCSCNGYSYRHYRCSLFTNEVTNVQKLPDKTSNTETIYIKVAVSDFNTQENNPNNNHILTGWKLWITVVTTLSAAVISSGLFIYHFWRDKLSQVKENDLLSYNFDDTNREEPILGEEHGRVITGYQIPLFKFSSVCATTNDFSAANKIGKGGFGAVYKGTLQNGEEIAIKRLSKSTPEKGSKEIKNEALLIAELRHENVVRLLGCCLDGNESIIIYEYFPLRSLDFFLFDPSSNKKLDWEDRTRIIHGIASGLNYLHEYSRLQIIHGDLKASNVLLDANMNPKVSDFAMTRIFGPKETLATNRMFGTFGYLSPEYAAKGIVSNKSDVFSFGVLVLEILSRKKNNFRNASGHNLLEHAWDLWKNNNALELIDSNMGESLSNKMKRYIEIAFLCVQESDNERPTMSDVVLYLENEGMDLPKMGELALSKARGLF